jgi:FkbM family methyltransferase
VANRPPHRQLQRWLRVAGETRGVYRNWPLAVADKVLLKGQVRLYRLRHPLGNGVSATTASLLATEWADTRIINELWIHDPYLRRFEPKEAVRTVVDVGANRGYFAVQVALLHPEATVLAYDPERRNLGLLEANVALNGLADRIEVHAVALVPDDRTEVVLHEAVHPGYHTTLDPVEAEASGITTWRFTGGTQTCAARNIAAELQAVVEQRGSIDVLKIDTEGTELPLLDAIDDATWDKVGYAVAEIAGPPAPEAEARWRELGFRVDTQPGYLFLER